MASGKLGKAALVAATDTDLYTVPVNTVSTVTVHFCNRTASPIAVRAAVRTGGLVDADYVYYDIEVPANDVRGYEGLVMGAGETLVVRAAAAGISARAMGFEEAA